MGISHSYGLAFSALALIISPTEAKNEKTSEACRPSRTDLYGDSLPFGASARLGTVRLHSTFANEFSFSEDGRSLLIGDETGVEWWSTNSGSRERRVNIKRADFVSFSPDRRLFAAVSRKEHADLLEVWVLEGPKLLRTIETRKGVRRISWSGDGQVIVAWQEKQFHIYSSQTGAEHKNSPHPEGIGSSYFSIAGVVSTSGRILAWANEKQQIRIWDRAGGELKTIALGPKDVVHCVRFLSGDKTIATIINGTLQIWDVKTGNRVCVGDAGSGLGFCLHITPDQKALLVNDGHGVYVIDSGSGKRLGYSRAPANLWQFDVSPNGKTVASTSRAFGVAIWDLETGKTEVDYPCHAAPVTAVAMSSDGALVASAALNSSEVYLWSAINGKLIKRMPQSEEKNDSGIVSMLAFLSDGKTLYCGYSSEHRAASVRDFDGRSVRGKGAVSHRLWDVSNGNRISSFLIKSPFADGAPFVTIGLTVDHTAVWTIHNSEMEGRCAAIKCAISNGSQMLKREWTSDQPGYGFLDPTGETLCHLGDEIVPPDFTRARTIVVENIRTAKALGQFEDERTYCPRLFSPDGLRLYGENPTTKEIACFELATKKSICAFDPLGSVGEMALSADGRVLAVATTGPNGGEISLWETVTGKNIVRLPKISETVSCFAITPYGTRWVSGLGDGNLIVWDMAEALNLESEGRLNESEWDRLWNNLKETDAGKGYAAILKMMNSPQLTLSLLKDRLKPTVPIPAKDLNRILGDLDSGKYTIRKAVSLEIVDRFDEAEGGLRSAMKNRNMSFEVRDRLESLLVQNPFLLGAERLRQYRAIQILENIGSSDAKAVLSNLSNGLATARQTREAKAALERLRAASIPVAP